MTKPKTKLKAKFCEFRDAIAIEIYYVDDRFFDLNSWPRKAMNRYLYGKRADIQSSEDFHIYFNYGIGIGRLLIRLSPNNDHRRFCITSSYSPRSDGRRLLRALKDWAKNWKGWKDEPAIEPVITKYEGGVTYVEV